MKKIFAVVLALVLTLALVTGCSDNKKQTGNASQAKTTQTATVNGTAGNKDAAGKATKADGNSGAAATVSGIRVEKGKAYTDKSHVAAYIHLFKTLPPNYITKAQAAKLGWKKQAHWIRLPREKVSVAIVSVTLKSSFRISRDGYGKNVILITAGATVTPSAFVFPMTA